MSDVFTYCKLSEEAKMEFNRSIKFQLKRIMETLLYKGNYLENLEKSLCWKQLRLATLGSLNVVHQHLFFSDRFSESYKNLGKLFFQQCSLFIHDRL